MANEKGPNIKKKQKCKNCEGKGLVKKGDKVLTCQRCKGTGVRWSPRSNDIPLHADVFLLCRLFGIANFPGAAFLQDRC